MIIFLSSLTIMVHPLYIIYIVIYNKHNILVYCNKTFPEALNRPTLSVKVDCMNITFLWYTFTRFHFVLNFLTISIHCSAVEVASVTVAKCISDHAQSLLSHVSFVLVFDLKVLMIMSEIQHYVLIDTAQALTFLCKEHKL